MNKEDFRTTREAEARLLLLINRFTTKKNCLEGRTKLAKLDFFLRYPVYMKRAIKIRDKEAKFIVPEEAHNIENRMIRYKYGPWDPSYYAVLGALIGKGLVKSITTKNGVGYITTELGQSIVNELVTEDFWDEIDHRTKLLKRYMNLAGTTLKKFIYKNFPEVTNTPMGGKL